MNRLNFGIISPNLETEQVKLLNELNQILDCMDIVENTTVIWGGESNLIFDTDLEADGGSYKLKIKSIAKIYAMMSENDLCDNLSN